VLATERLLNISEGFAARVQRIVPIELDSETLRVVFHLKDGTTLRVTEQWRGQVLLRYSYYWLTSANELKVGWDNAPHHTQLASFPHHKHIGYPGNLYPSRETCLQQVMDTIDAGRAEVVP
jgi:hypothetical protein